MGYLLMNSVIKKTNFHFSSSACNISQFFQSNIHGSIFSESLCIARCTLKLEHFLPRASKLYLRMLSQGDNQSCINKQILYFSKIAGRTTGVCQGHAMDFRFLCKLFSKLFFFLVDDFQRIHIFVNKICCEVV